MVEAGSEECNVNKDCPAGRFCDVHTCRACLHPGATCHFIGEKSRNFLHLNIRHFKKYGSIKSKRLREMSKILRLNLRWLYMRSLWEKYSQNRCHYEDAQLDSSYCQVVCYVRLLSLLLSLKVDISK